MYPMLSMDRERMSKTHWIWWLRESTYGIKVKQTKKSAVKEWKNGEKVGVKIINYFGRFINEK